MRSRGVLSSLMAVAVLAALTACQSPGTPEGTGASAGAGGAAPPSASAAPAPCATPASSALVPATGAWWGVSIDWAHDSLAAYTERLGAAPAVAVTFAGLPLSRQDKGYVDAAVAQARGVGSMLLLTLEPHDGLDVVTRRVAAALARRLDGYNRSGVPVVVRFAHEMNGSWYPWAQDPRGYVGAFRTMASAVHARAPGSAMMWAPNYGGGYPFAGGDHQAGAGSEAERLLDTDGDGALTGADDPYAPYWPGEAYVDWVGMSLYHWGSRYPWGENERPESGKFGAMLRGTYRGAAGDERQVPDFYDRYGTRRGLPVAVTETAAFYRPAGGGRAELAIKRDWWRQVLADDHATSLPLLKMINWFEWEKLEPEVGVRVDWTVTRRPATLRRLRAAQPDWLRFADAVPHCG